MKRFLQSCLLFVCGFAAGLSFLSIYWVSPVSWDLRSNGIDWPQFGPSFIPSLNTSKVIVMLGRLNVAVTDRRKIDGIKRWVDSSGIVKRMNYAPMWPTFRGGQAIISADGIYFFADVDSQDDTGRIMSLPLTPSSLGVSENEFGKKMEDLKVLIGTQ